MDQKSSFKKFGSSLVGTDKVKELKDVLGGHKDPEVVSTSTPEDVPKSLPQADPMAEIHALEQKLKDAENLASEQKDRELRLAADFENRKKRMDREREEIIKYGNEKLLVEMIPIIDHLEMTLVHATEAKAEKDPVVEGVEMVLKQLLGALEKFGVGVILGEGEPFDPNSQEAIGVSESKDHPEGSVLQVHRKGYTLHGRVMRPAMVTTAKKPV